MGLFSRRPPAPARTQPPGRLGFHRESILVADPDGPSSARVLGLQAFAARGMQGATGTVIGYDKGDAAHSLTGPVNAAPSPTVAVANVSKPSDSVMLGPVAEYSDLASADPEQGSYAEQLFSRIGRK